MVGQVSCMRSMERTPLCDEPLSTTQNMAAAVIDRIVHHGWLLQFRGEPYRVKHALMK